LNLHINSSGTILSFVKNDIKYNLVNDTYEYNKDNGLVLTKNGEEILNIPNF